MTSHKRRAPRPLCPRQRRDEAELYRRHQSRLLRSVQGAVGGRRDLAEDGCAFAWAQLVAHQPERGERLFGWLRKVALHEAWRLAERDSREAALEELVDDVPGGEWEALVPAPVSMDHELAAREALRALAALRPRERRYLALKIGGHSYREIQQICGGRSYTNVNKHLVRARARLHEVRLGA